MPWTTRNTRPIPSLSARTDVLELNDYSLGMNSYVSNDKFPVRNGQSNLWRLAQDARIPTLGEYETRKGFDFHSAAAGETQDQAVTSTTGTADQSFNETARLAQKWTAGASGRLSKYEVRIKNDASATGTVIVEHWTDSSGSPGVMVARSSIAGSTPTSSYAYLTARFATAPVVTSGTSYWIVTYVQATASGSYKWSSTTTATTAKTSSTSGSSWSAASFALNFKQHYATSGGVKGLHRAYKSDGTAVTLLAHGTVLYKVDDVTGALTSVKTGLSASATHYRFQTVNDIVYYVNGFDGLRKWDFTTESQVRATNYTHICLHKGLLMLTTKDDPTAEVYSNFGEYETYTSTDLFYADAPNTGDPITAKVSLGGVLLIWTRDNKFMLGGDDNATFSVDRAPDNKGTYSQETVAVDGNFVYYLSDDGVYRSNGSEAQLLSQNIYEDIVRLENKDDCVLAVNKGRLYLWYKSDGSSYNDRCYVWNLNYGGEAGTVESLDTDAVVDRALTAFRDSDGLLVASSLIGQVYWQEQESNDYTNLGGPINWELDTHHHTGASPAVLKAYRKWLPRFGAQDGAYSVSCDYAYDQRDNWQTRDSVSVQGSGTLWGSGAVWGSFTWGSTAEVSASLHIPGEYKRTAVRYKHHACRQPIRFLGHTLERQTRRLR